MFLDIEAPIIPFNGMGEIKLYSTRDELKELLEREDVKSNIIFGEWISYEIQNSVELFFHLRNNKLFKITALDNYKGKLFDEICVGTSEEEMLAIEPTFVYDDFEEVWESEKGVLIEMDAETNKVKWISVYIPELYADSFDECKW